MKPSSNSRSADISEHHDNWLRVTRCKRLPFDPQEAEKRVQFALFRQWTRTYVMWALKHNMTRGIKRWL